MNGSRGSREMRLCSKAEEENIMVDHRFIQSFESRVLMSATTISVFSAAVKVDQAQIRADLAKFKADCLQNTATMLGDITAIKSDDPSQASTLAPLVKTFRTDLRTMKLELAADRAAQASAELADQSVIYTDLVKIIHDKSNATALATDHSNLLAERIKLQNDAIAGLNTRIATRENAYTTILADGQAIVTAVGSDSNASAKLQTAVAKWFSDKTVCLNTMTTDLAKLVADRTQLVADLTAMQSST
jgi:hypothetical protein